MNIGWASRSQIRRVERKAHESLHVNAEGVTRRLVKGVMISSQLRDIILLEENESSADACSCFRNNLAMVSAVCTTYMPV